MGRLSFFPFRTVQREREGNEGTLGNSTVFIVSTNVLGVGLFWVARFANGNEIMAIEYTLGILHVLL